MQPEEPSPYVFRRRDDAQRLTTVEEEDAVLARVERMRVAWSSFERDDKAFPMTGQGVVTGLFGPDEDGHDRLPLIARLRVLWRLLRTWTWAR